MTADDFAEHLARVRARFASALNGKVADNFAALERMSHGGDGGELIETVVSLSAGRGGRIRTCDPLLPKQMRYRAALRPDGTSAGIHAPAQASN